MARGIIIFLVIVVLPGCIAGPLIARMTHDGKGQFETWVNAKVGKTYADACYSRGQTICGPFVESRQTDLSVEQVHRVAYRCVFGLVTAKDTGAITAWRYISAPDECWVYVPTA